MRRKEGLNERAICIYALRSLRGWTQEELAKGLGIPVSALSEHENGKRYASDRVVRRVCEVVGIPTDRLLDLEAILREMRELLGGTPPLPGRGARETLAEELYLQFEVVASRAVDAVLGRGGAGQAPGILRDLLSADDLWGELEEVEMKERLAMVEEGAEYQTWDLCALLCEESRKAVEDGGESALELAELALHVAERVSGEEEWRACVQAFAWAHLAHARRERGDRAGAGEAFASFRQLWRDGASGRLLLLDEARIADLENLVSALSGSPH